MIYDVTGDILKTRAAALAHGIAPDDDFNQGLALALHTAWPAMVKDYRHYAHSHGAKAGDAWIWSGPGARVVNLLTQEPKGDHGAHAGKATTHNVRHALKALRKIVERESLSSLALPRLATGVGGLDWATVRPMIEEALGDLSVPVYVYATYHPGVAADEPGV